MPELLVPRTAPKDHLWATENDPVTTNFAKSQEWALDSLLPEWRTYPAWPNYPDERNLPVGAEARAQWAKRRPLRLAELEAQKVNPKVLPKTPNKPRTETAHTTETPHILTPSALRCICGTELVKPERGPMKQFCSNKCRMKAARST